jgi:deoxyribonucleoside regulator
MTRHGENEGAANVIPLDDKAEHLMVQIARMAYLQQKTLTEIAAETGINRWRVSRLLQEARDLGIVRIEIVPRSGRCPDLETELIARFGLRDAVVVPGQAVVVPGQADGVQGMEGIAQAAGQYLASLKPRPSVVGVSWGRTMSAVAHWLPSRWNEGVTVVQINGTVALNANSERTNDVAETFARKASGRYVPLPVPAIVGERATREVLERDRIVRDVLELARSAQVLCFSFGSLDHDSVLLQSGNVLEAEQRALIDAGAIGDVLSRFIDRHGAVVDRDMDDRTIGLPLDILKNHPHAIGIAAGRAKHDVTIGVLRAGLVSVLVTDEATATHVLEYAK